MMVLIFSEACFLLLEYLNKSSFTNIFFYFHLLDAALRIFYSIEQLPFVQIPEKKRFTM